MGEGLCVTSNLFEIAEGHLLAMLTFQLHLLALAAINYGSFYTIEKS